jgi:hypothetical protein
LVGLIGPNHEERAAPPATIPTADEERFKREWSVTTPGANLTETTTTIANTLLYTHFLFFGCAADKAGKCDITADVTFYAPRRQGGE